MLSYVFYIKFEDGNGKTLTIQASSYAEAYEKIAKIVADKYADIYKYITLEDITYNADVEIFEQED